MDDWMMVGERDGGWWEGMDGWMDRGVGDRCMDDGGVQMDG